jgi:hypothetical protein
MGGAMKDIGTWARCPICQEYGFTGQHTCKPEWEACDAEEEEWETVRGRDAEEEEWETVRGRDAVDAAETYCARRDPFAEYGRVEASRSVLVRPVGRDDQRRRYIVTGELQPVYNAILQQYVGDE